MKAIILKAKPYSMFRLGSGSLYETDKIIHSDTLFSAIVNVHSKVFENTNEFIEQFDAGNIKISSAFPVLISNNEKIYFLPKPELNFSTDKNIKVEKKIKFVSVKLFSEIIKDGMSDFTFTDNSTIIGSSFAVSKTEVNSNNEINGFIKEIITPKTKVHSPDQEGNFYHETDIQLIPVEMEYKSYTPSFYFFYQLNCNGKIEEEFITSLRILADEGIGGERSTGKGQLEKIIDAEVDLLTEQNSNTSMLLSLFNPSNQNEFDAFKNYEIVVRGGGSVSFDSEDDDQEQDIAPFRKKQVRMIAEGAVFEGEINGKLVDVSPELGTEHKHYRNGKCFSIPLG